MECKGWNYELITEIAAYAENSVEFAGPMEIFKKHVSTDEFTLSEEDALKVPFRIKSAALDEEHSVSPAGDSYQVTLTWELEKMTQAAYQAYETLRRGCNHIVVSTLGGNRAMVRADSDGYSFSYEDSRGTVSCTLSVTNVSGIQRILSE